jgi:hypothetical protein
VGGVGYYLDRIGRQFLFCTLLAHISLGFNGWLREASSKLFCFRSCGFFWVVFVCICVVKVNNNVY